MFTKNDIKKFQIYNLDAHTHTNITHGSAITTVEI